jgi:hypothetical protein
VGPLGCADDYQVAIYDREGEAQRGEVEPSEVTWTRVLDDTSEAQVTVPYAGIDCCQLLGDTRTWCNTLVISRDGDRVWEGPITRISYTDEETVISARDVSQWLFRRKIRELLAFTAPQQDLAYIAEALIQHGLAPDDPNVLPYLHVLPSGIVGARSYAADSGYVLDALRELGRTGVDWTALGRRIIISGEQPLGRLATLSDEDFLGQLTIVEDGLAAATDATVIGKGVRGHAGGMGACGLLEVLVTEEEILDTSSAQAEAQAIVNAGYPSPIYLEVPDGVQLASDAPVSISDLIPGVVIPVASERTCRTVAADLRLLKVTASFTADAGERVGVSLAPAGVDTTA